MNSFDSSCYEPSEDATYRADALAAKRRARVLYLSTGGLMWISILGMLGSRYGTGIIFASAVFVAASLITVLIGQVFWFGHRRRQVLREDREYWERGYRVWVESGSTDLPHGRHHADDNRSSDGYPGNEPRTDRDIS